MNYLVPYDKFMHTGAIRVNRGNIYDDRLCYWLRVLDFNIKQITVIYPKRVMACLERAKVKIAALVSLNGLDERAVIPSETRPTVVI